MSELLGHTPAEAAADGSPELWQLVREKVVQPGGLYFLNKALLGFADLTPRAHKPMCLFYEDDTIHNKLCEFPKSHLKTTCGTVGKTLHVFAKRVVLEQDPTDRVALASSTKTNSMRFLRLVKTIVESSMLFQTFFPELIPEFSNEEAWNQEEIVFPRVRKFTDPSVDTLGVGGAATSRHYTLIIEDDMLNEESADSPTAIRKAIDLHKYYTSLLVDDDCHFITNEHAWTEYDVNKHIIESEPETAVFSVGASAGLNEERSRHVPEYIVELADAWKDGQCVWPERYGRESLRKRREKAGARIYNAVYESNPFDPDVVDFREEWLRYFDWTADGDIRIRPTKGVEMEVVKLSSLNRVGAFDPALSKKTTAANSAIVCTGVDPQDRVFLLDVYARREDPLKVLETVVDKVKRWKLQQMAVETVLFQKVLFDVLQRTCKKHGIFPGTFKEIRPAKGKGKEERIRALLGTSFAEGRVYVHSSQHEFLNEYLHFPLSRTVDVLDALAYSSMLWLRGEEVGEVEAALADEAAWMARRDEVTGY